MEYIFIVLIILAILLIVIIYKVKYSHPTSLPLPVDAKGTYSNDEIKALDIYLKHWDDFAQGKEGFSYIKKYQLAFQNTLTNKLEETNLQVIPRIVFYFFVQVFLFLPANSRLYLLLHKISEGALVAADVEEENKYLDSAQVWLWWKKNQHKYPEYELLENWLSRPFATDTVIPRYERFAIESKK